MDTLRRLYFFFSRYANTDERAVGLFFSQLTEHRSQSKTKAQLGELLQRNIAALNLWSEYQYKGYKYLRKSTRKKLYANLQLITDDFEQFRASKTCSAESVIARIHHLAPQARVDSERALVLQALMDYFSPERGVYCYRESSSFGRLLRDPSHETLVGDCNQIVTLYLYLYSRYFSVHDLQVRLLPQHVALHYGGIDIEATSGTFAHYASKKDTALMPVEEIVSINLLDTTDSYLDTHHVDPKEFLQASRFAFILSHERAIVTRNLEAAYGSLINSLMNQHNYAQALTFAKQSRDMELLAIVGNNGAVYHMQRHEFAAARRLAAYAPDHTTLVRNSYHAEGVYHYNAHRYHDAIKAFKHCGDHSFIQRCYEALFFAEQAKLGTHLTTASLKGHAATINRMHSYAKQSGNKQLVEHAVNLRKHL